MISISRDIDAPTHELFAYLVRPAHHVAIDGSGMVRAGDEEQVLSGAGDVFEMQMCNDFLGDYVIENQVVEFEPDRRIAWEPVLKETDHPEARTMIGVPAHLRWVWELTPLPDGRSRVTEAYDLSRCPEWLHEATEEGETWRSSIEASLANLAALAEQRE
jgi:uncharacterized protein YndB with AHSA1/START domain